MFQLEPIQMYNKTSQLLTSEPFQMTSTARKTCLTWTRKLPESQNGCTFRPVLENARVALDGRTKFWGNAVPLSL